MPFEQEPDGSGTPLLLRSHRALAVGDVSIAIEGELRVWWGYAHDDPESYARRLLPSLHGWLDLPVDRLLISHGPQVEGGLDALAGALGPPPHTLE